MADPMDEFWSYDYMINPMNIGALVVIRNPKKSPEEILNKIKQNIRSQDPSNRIRSKLTTFLGYLFFKPVSNEELEAALASNCEMVRNVKGDKKCVEYLMERKKLLWT
jgi:hypothetical protein